MWLGCDLRHPLVVRADGCCSPRNTGIAAPIDGRPFSVASSKLSIDSRELVAKIISENL